MKQQGRLQADIVRDLGWERGRTSKVFNGVQPYCRGDVIQLSQWLGIEPFELLMSPREAIAMRQLREAARQIAAQADGAGAAHKPEANDPVAQSAIKAKLPSTR